MTRPRRSSSQALEDRIEVVHERAETVVGFIGRSDDRSNRVQLLRAARRYAAAVRTLANSK